MILHWNALTRYYGSALEDHRHRFQHASQTTYALLCCRLAPGDDRLASSGGEHAERRLLRSDLWTSEIPAALGARSDFDSGPMVVTLALNRSPCATCTVELTDALRALQWEFPARFTRSRFILASRGAYQGQVTEKGYYSNATTVAGLQRLRGVGWELCVLQEGSSLPPSGGELLQALGRIQGRTGVVDLR